MRQVYGGLWEFSRRAPQCIGSKLAFLGLSQLLLRFLHLADCGHESAIERIYYLQFALERFACCLRRKAQLESGFFLEEHHLALSRQLHVNWRTALEGACGCSRITVSGFLEHFRPAGGLIAAASRPICNRVEANQGKRRLAQALESRSFFRVGKKSNLELSSGTQRLGFC
jgi:hypothetical protein